MNSAPRTIRVGAAGLLTAGLLVAGGAVSTVAAAAGCTPYVLPGLPSGDGSGEIITISSSGLYGGDATAADGHYHAVWWTHSGTDMSTGWVIHQVPGPTTDDFVADINSHGVMLVTGSDAVTGNGEGYLYDVNSGVVTMLPGLGGGDYDRRLNDSGVVAGTSWDAKGAAHAVTWSPPYSAPNKLPDLGASQSYGTQDYSHYKAGQQATGIDSAGHIVGAGFVGSHQANTSEFARNHQWRPNVIPGIEPLEWQTNGSPQKLPTGNEQGLAWAINDNGLIVGSILDNTTFNSRPVAWVNGQPVDMGAPSDIVFGNAYGLSSGGWAAGGISWSDNTARAFVWSQANGFRTLDPPAGFGSSWSHAPNDHLQEVGGSADNGGAGTPVVWQC